MSIIDKYPMRVFFRISEDDKIFLENIADHYDKPVSCYVRSIVERELRKERRKHANKKGASKTCK